MRDVIACFVDIGGIVDHRATLFKLFFHNPQDIPYATFLWLHDLLFANLFSSSISLDVYD